MSAQENAAAVQALNDAFNARDWDAAAARVTEDAESVNVATGETFSGPDGIRRFLQGWATAFPDSTVETTKVVADDDSAVIEFTGRGTHNGPLQGPMGEIPPTGRAATVSFVQVTELREGRIARARLYFDAAGMLAQLGLMPAPAQAGAQR